MSLPLVIKLKAEADLAQAKAWYDGEREGLGDEFLGCVEEAFEQIRRFPRIGATVYLELRRKLVRRFPYAVFYRIEDDQISVVAVYDCRRDPRGWQKRA